MHVCGKMHFGGKDKKKPNLFTYQIVSPNRPDNWSPQLGGEMPHLYSE